ncbi:MAG TPA: VOC family protein [Thermomicrobiales bacterium]|nr:VOC family protein [Thermomicrobiales bacterium]
MTGADDTGIKILFAGIAVADYGTAVAWYERFFGRPPDVPVAEQEAMWQVAAAGWVYVVGDAGRAGNALLTLAVDNLDARVATLAERGLTATEFETVPGGRKAGFDDPEGNRITLAESHGAAD